MSVEEKPKAGGADAWDETDLLRLATYKLFVAAAAATSLAALFEISGWGEEEFGKAAGAFYAFSLALPLNVAEYVLLDSAGPLHARKLGAPGVRRVMFHASLAAALVGLWQMLSSKAPTAGNIFFAAVVFAFAYMFWATKFILKVK